MVLQRLDRGGEALGPLALRLLLAVEFGSSGWEKWNGQNWFADIQDRFPFPFDHLPPAFSWQLATYFELAGAAALLLGLGVRFFAVCLLVVTWVATVAVHWPESWSSLSDLARGYVISDQGYGNYKLPLIYGVMLLPLLLRGGGSLTLDACLRRRWLRSA